MLRHCHLNILIKGILSVKAYHICTRNHNLPYIAVGKIKNIIHKIQLSFVNITLFVTFLHKNANLVLCMSCFLAFSLHRDSQLFRGKISHMIQKPNKWIHYLLKKQHRHSNPQGYRLGLLYGQILWNQLTTDNMHSRNQTKGYGKGNGSGQGSPQATVFKYRLQHFADCRLT